ncbi:NAD(P)/FAD-dependent oxidoreductase [Candidatus Methylacidiphilum infernorum]|uniref:NADH:ubiquinone reductase (non-electrogenic) n=1 Tax=Candidatus Methylacidiphilum infernorum TaxID=511746 RepID=A0ABX7PWZ2_9BACT|nr:NAD(P)/FAD-dependent oxidoreductase [Candidatus Methylacidiphilum infernorum]QSR87166.1 NAD(P)/FAD-dependent oxidoreductase [Candidatus Methylacidiphilum infernorum]
MIAPRIVICGAGFGGLSAAKTLGKWFSRSGRSGNLLLIDKENYHLFQPLLYQVATAGLSGPDIAVPIRSILRRFPQISVRMDEIQGVDLEKQAVFLAGGTVQYDYLILALGAVTSYFGHSSWSEYAVGLKTLYDAHRIRSQLLRAFEEAENTENFQDQEELLTVVVVGGGPTGVELAGAIAELARRVLRLDFRRIDPTKARILLIEAGPRLLGEFPERLGRIAEEKLRSLGVEVRLSAPVQDICRRLVVLPKETIRAATIIWAAGVRPHPLAETLPVPKDRSGRLLVLPDLSLPDYRNVFAIGDLVSVACVPGTAPAAMQMGRHVANLIIQEIASGPGQLDNRAPFRYKDKGMMATIGRAAAVARIRRVAFNGPIAWFAWLFIHLFYLIGFRNKVSVLLQWIWAYLTYRPGARILLRTEEHKTPL